MQTIISERPTGGILHLPVALEQYPDRGLTGYHRVSEYGSQTGGRGTPKLIEKADAIRDEVRRLAPGRLRRVPFYGVESGKVYKPRPCLLEAAECAKDYGLILVAADLSRFIRAERYDRRRNREAWPTEDEFERLRELTGGIVLATIAPPRLKEAERHSLATKRNSHCGRPSALTQDQQWKALLMLGRNVAMAGEPCEWTGRSTGQVAELLGVTKPALNRFLHSSVPGSDEVRWCDLQNPAKAFQAIHFPEIDT